MSSKKKSSETSSYVPPKTPVKIQKGDRGYILTKKNFHKMGIPEKEQAPETGAYDPPISPVKIQKGDTGFKTVKDGYRRFIWTFKEYIGKKPKFPKV